MNELAMKIKHPKLRGEWAELRFMAAAAEHGFHVTKPWGETLEYDFILESAAKFVRVQVKSTGFKDRGGYSCSVRRCRGAYEGDPFDYAAVYVVPEDLWYIIPEEVVHGKKSIMVYPYFGKSKYEPYREAWGALGWERAAPSVPYNAGMKVSRTENLVRCDWARNELAIEYHDREWGVPQHDDRVLFEFLVLEGAQAGLSWDTILRKRENYRAALDGFDAKKIARYDKRKLESLMRNEGIVRNRLKIGSVVKNAKAFLEIQKGFGSFDRYVWQFVGGKPKVNTVRSLRDVQARTPESDAMSKDLQKRGFTFVGSTICYAFMQAVGMVNDHLLTCFRYREVQ